MNTRRLIIPTIVFLLIFPLALAGCKGTEAEKNRPFEKGSASWIPKNLLKEASLAIEEGMKKRMDSSSQLGKESKGNMVSEKENKGKDTKEPPSQGENNETPPNYTEWEYTGKMLVLFTPEATKEQARSVLEKHRCSIENLVINDILHYAMVIVPSDRNPEDVANELLSEPIVEAAYPGKRCVTPPDERYEHGVVVVSFIPQASEEQARCIISAHNCTIESLEFLGDHYVACVKIPSDKTEDDLIAEFQREPLVKCAEKNWYFSGCVKGEIVVGFKVGVSQETVIQVVAKHHCEIESFFEYENNGQPGIVVVLFVPDGKDENNVANEFLLEDTVRSAERMYI